MSLNQLATFSVTESSHSAAPGALIGPYLRFSAAYAASRFSFSFSCWRECYICALLSNETDLACC